MAAIDLVPGHEGLSEAIAIAVSRLIATEPGARLACVNVIKGSLLHIDPTEDADGRSLHLQRLIELKHWARELPLPAERITFHALEAVDAAAALIDFVRTNRADHIVIGARASSALRRYLGSVSSQVVAEAPCTVTVVRTGGSRPQTSVDRAAHAQAAQSPTEKGSRKSCGNRASRDFFILVVRFFLPSERTEEWSLIDRHP